MKGKRQEFSVIQWVHLHWSPFRVTKAIGSSESKVKPFTPCQSYTEMKGDTFSIGTHIALP